MTRAGFEPATSGLTSRCSTNRAIYSPIVAVSPFNLFGECQSEVIQPVTVGSIIYRRYMFGLSILPAVIQGVGMFLLPPSPRFLMQKGKESQARTVLQKLRGTELIEGELSVIRNSLLTELVSNKKTELCREMCCYLRLCFYYF